MSTTTTTTATDNTHAIASLRRRISAARQSIERDTKRLESLETPSQPKASRSAKSTPPATTETPQLEE